MTTEFKMAIVKIPEEFFSDMFEARIIYDILQHVNLGIVFDIGLRITIICFFGTDLVFIIVNSSFRTLGYRS